MINVVRTKLKCVDTVERKYGEAGLKARRRVPCLNNCGVLIPQKQGECRKCRRKRVLEGKRRIWKLEFRNKET